MSLEGLFARLQAVEQRIQAACHRAGRPREDVQLLMASKKVSPEILRGLASQKNILLGENTAQELVQKYQALAELPFAWHFIGHLQSNKVKDVVGRCSLIHSVDRWSLAQEISQRSLQKSLTTAVLIEVNTSAESNKSGLPPEQVLTFCQQILALPRLRIEGLMTIAANTDNEQEVRKNFRSLKKLAQDISTALPQLPMQTLSMGMSQDFEWAIEEGSTLIRIGSLIFGKRVP